MSGKNGSRGRLQRTSSDVVVLVHEGALRSFSGRPKVGSGSVVGARSTDVLSGAARVGAEPGPRREPRARPSRPLPQAHCL